MTGWQDDDVRVVREGRGWSLVRAGEVLAEPFLELSAAMRAGRRVARDAGVDLHIVDRSGLAGTARYRPRMNGLRPADRFPVRLRWAAPRHAEFDYLPELPERIDWFDVASGLQVRERRVKFEAEDDRDDDGRWVYTECAEVPSHRRP
ncbi:MAG: hypothetical protein KJ061_03000 [Vicinamibacteraceae bacterium]|nr:hypothetical protein [Vicinamibacteraceae bacterium]MCL4846210.1 hypothetical protein [Acidobacteriota bacterium]